MLGVHPGGELTAPARRVDQASRGMLREALSDMSGKAGATLLLRRIAGTSAERVLLVGLGERKDFSEAAFRSAVRAAAAALRDMGAKDAVLYLVDLRVGQRHLTWNVRHAVLGVQEAFYRFDELKTQNKAHTPS
ncbi:MAG TPA: M17 family peptidase N-terminal domain-containing protein, partial [Gammaproteobacteria bacterium]|nr:M17 family peptidase N-terminal domain-containing protein [Gammaproteobacteria bacterium]